MTGEKQYFQFFYIRAYKIMEIKNSKKRVFVMKNLFHIGEN